MTMGTLCKFKTATKIQSRLLPFGKIDEQPLSFGGANIEESERLDILGVRIENDVR